MKIFAIALLMTIAAPAVAQTAAPVAATAIHKGQNVKDAAGSRLGEVDRIIPAADGSVAAVRIIYGQAFVTIPGNTLTLVEGTLQTSLTKSAVNKL